MFVSGGMIVVAGYDAVDALVGTQTISLRSMLDPAFDTSTASVMRTTFSVWDASSDNDNAGVTSIAVLTPDVKFLPMSAATSSNVMQRSTVDVRGPSTFSAVAVTDYRTGSFRQFCGAPVVRRLASVTPLIDSGVRTLVFEGGASYTDGQYVDMSHAYDVAINGTLWGVKVGGGASFCAKVELEVDYECGRTSTYECAAVCRFVNGAGLYPDDVWAIPVDVGSDNSAMPSAYCGAPRDVRVYVTHNATPDLSLATMCANLSAATTCCARDAGRRQILSVTDGVSPDGGIAFRAVSQYTVKPNGANAQIGGGGVLSANPHDPELEASQPHVGGTFY
jgi:hypothetical protein